MPAPSAPPGLAPTTSHRRHQERRDHQYQVRTEALIRFAHQVLDASGIDRSSSWITRAVKAYQRDGARTLFGTWLCDRLYAELSNGAPINGLSHADPTAVDAIRKVMRGGAA